MTVRLAPKTIYDAPSGMHSRPSGLDPLATIIDLLRPEAVVSKIVSGAGRWSVRYAAHEQPGFCVVLEGSCFLDVQGAAAIELGEGDFVLLPASPAFVLASDPAMKPARVSAVDRDVRHGTKAGPPTMRMLGGYFRFDRANAQVLLRLLPVMVHIRHDEPGSARLRRIVELLGEETHECRPGRDLIVERLVEVLLVEALRFRPASAARQERGLLAGLADPGLARALRRIHEDVAHRWTVAELARAAGMSRAVFAERFTRTVGLPPMQYLLEWRIAIAKDVLRRDRARLAEVAEKVGYQSASAFSVAFTRHAGCSPSAFARSGGA
jgi:AraC-like DNA-binding protein